MVNGKLIFTIVLFLIPILIIIGAYYSYWYVVSDYNIGCIKKLAAYDCPGEYIYNDIKFKNGEWFYNCKDDKTYHLFEETAMCLRYSRR